MPERFTFRGARVVDPASGRDEISDVFVEDGVVSSDAGSDATVLGCEGLVLAPGLVDLHTHLRQPGREDKETVETGCRAGAVGGFTAVGLPYLGRAAVREAGVDRAARIDRQQHGERDEGNAPPRPDHSGQL